MAKLFYQPISPYVVGQKFGDNKVCIDNATSTNYISCDGHNPPAGYRSIYSQMDGHNGNDIPSRRWKPVYAAREGMVIEVETELERGLGVGIRHNFGKESIWKTRYWHFIASVVELGQEVSTGQMIGYVDSTGYSTGDHLHFEVKRLNPDGSNMHPNNGYFGAEDPEPLLFDIPAVKVNSLRLWIEKIAATLESLVDTMRESRTG